MKLSQKETVEVTTFIRSGIEEIWDEYPTEWDEEQMALASVLIFALLKMWDSYTLENPGNMNNEK